MNQPGWLCLADTLIRAVLHIDPDTLDDDMWAHQVLMAEWAKQELYDKQPLRPWQTQ